jgi:hypothetical protein
MFQEGNEARAQRARTVGGAFRRGIQNGSLVLTVAWMVAGEVRGDAFSSYGPPVNPWNIHSLPGVGAGSFSVAYDVLADGRVVAVTGNRVFVESGVNSNAYDVLATFDSSATGGSIDPSFVRVSPDGARLAVGGGFGKPVAVFDTVELGTPGSPSTLTRSESGGATRYYAIGHFDGEWADNTNLAMTAGSFGSAAFVTLLDTTSSPAAPTNPVIVDLIDGASSGITFDAAGRLYTGNGLDNSPGATGTSVTGTIRAFDAIEWQAAIGGTPLDFESDGVFVAELLSAAALGFDEEGNLFVGGADFGNGVEPFDAGYMALIDDASLADALAGVDAITPGDVSELRTFDPEGSGFTSFLPNANPITGELLAGWVGGFSEGAPAFLARTVPAPAPVGLLIAGAVVAARRRGGRMPC